ncbi:MAG: DUF4124 domain-containing protein [Comamonadaceae bacterium]|nr:DUF4124 domain-containing protein [Burkholderiales bacterium]MEB2348137.1 DUF4124 domain-containing protein [Comamonadaceae bacterium]
MKPHKLFLLAVIGTWALGAAAQWQWVDKDGRTVFSDRPPPMDVPQKNIRTTPHVLVPRTAAAAAAPSASTTPQATPDAATQPAVGAAPAPADAGKDKALEEQKARMEAAEAAKKQAEDKAKAEKEAKARADNCTRARQQSAALQPGRLVGTTNAQGERGYMDDATRAAELKRAEQIIQRDCR